MLVFDAVGIGGIVVLQPKVFTLGDAIGSNNARGLFTKFAVLHDCGSGVQTRGSEQRAKPPSKSGEPVASWETSLVCEHNKAGQTKPIQRVISANWVLESGVG